MLADDRVELGQRRVLIPEKRLRQSDHWKGRYLREVDDVPVEDERRTWPANRLDPVDKGGLLDEVLASASRA
jgi:hypothetical protein